MKASHAPRLGFLAGVSLSVSSRFSKTVGVLQRQLAWSRHPDVSLLLRVGLSATLWLGGMLAISLWSEL